MPLYEILNDGTVKKIAGSCQLMAGDGININNGVISTKNNTKILYQGILGSSSPSFEITGLDIKNGEVLGYVLSFLNSTSTKSDITIKIESDEGISTDYNTIGQASGSSSLSYDSHHRQTHFYSGYVLNGRMHCEGKFIVVDGDATFNCSAFNCGNSDNQTSIRLFGGACNLAGEQINKIKFGMTSSSLNYPSQTHLVLYKMAKEE